MSQKARVRNQEVDHQNEEDGRPPSRDFVIAELEVWILPVGFDRLIAQKQEHPDGRANCGAVEVEDELLEDGVDAAGDQPERTGEEEKGGQGAVFGFEAFEERDESDDVEEKVNDGLVDEGIGVQSVYYMRHVSGLLRSTSP